MTKKEQQLSFNGINFTLIRGGVKNINMRIDHDGNLRISAPTSATDKQIFDFVYSKKDWIEKHQNKLRPSGGCFFLFGENVPLSRLGGKSVGEFYSESTYLKERYNRLCNVLEISPAPELVIKPMKSKYGSYNKTKHRVCLNLFLLAAPKECIDYVIFHELTHTVHFNHGKGFHNMLSRYVPNEKELKDVLGKYVLW